MRLETALECVASLPQPDSFSQFAEHLDPAWIEEALSATGVATMRRRRLPAEQVPWLVIGMAMMRNRPITEVVSKLDLALPKPGKPTVAPSAIPPARDRLGESPMAWLFAHSADHWAHKSANDARWRDLAVYGVDGTTLKVPDSEENREHFGLVTSGHRGPSGYPLVRMVALMALRSREVAAASFGPYKKSEHHYMADLWPCVPDHSLLILDRLFWSLNILYSLQNEGEERHWLIRGKSNLGGKVLKRLGPKQELREFRIAPQTRAKNSSLPKKFTARVIRYQRKGFRPQTLITSLLDPKTHPRAELVEMYHERWEIELGFREVKTNMLGSVPLRSKSVARVRQEIWGILIAYNLIRLEIARIAKEASVQPIRISFVMVFRMICDEWLWCELASPGAIPRRLRDLRAKVADFIIPPRRRTRSYPRAVKVKMSSYARKRRPNDVPPGTRK